MDVNNNSLLEVYPSLSFNDNRFLILHQLIKLKKIIREPLIVKLISVNPQGKQNKTKRERDKEKKETVRKKKTNQIQFNFSEYHNQSTTQSHNDNGS